MKSYRDAKGRFIKGHGLIKPRLNPTPYLAYFLGALKGDGCLYHSDSYRKWLIILTVRNRRFAEKFALALSHLNLNPHLLERNLRGKTIYDVTAYSKILFNWVKEIIISHLENLLVKNQLEVYFLRGFFDAEGSYFETNDRGYRVRQLTFTNTDLELMKLIRKLLLRFGFSNKINKLAGKGWNKKPIYRLKYS